MEISNKLIIKKKKIPLRKISFNKKKNNNNNSNGNTTFNLNFIKKYSFNRFNNNPQAFIFNFNTINNDNSNNIINLFHSHNLQQSQNNQYFKSNSNNNSIYKMKFRNKNEL